MGGFFSNRERVWFLIQFPSFSSTIFDKTFMMDFREKIVSVAGRILGKPTIKGTPIMVELVLQKFARGFYTDEILEMYPKLKIEDLDPAIALLKKITLGKNN